MPDVIVLHVIVCRSQKAVPEAQSDKHESITHMDSGLLHMVVALLHETCDFIYKLRVQLKVQTQIIYQHKDMRQN